MSLELKASATALVLIDLQRGVLSLPLTPHPADGVVARSLELAQACAAAGRPVVGVNVAFDPENALRLKQPVDRHRAHSSADRPGADHRGDRGGAPPERHLSRDRAGGQNP